MKPDEFIKHHRKFSQTKEYKEMKYIGQKKASELNDIKKRWHEYNRRHSAVTKYLTYREVK